jgi:hypothetical protein
MKNKLATFFITLVLISTTQKIFAQGNWWTGCGYLRSDVASWCGCGFAFEMDSSYRPIPTYQYIWLIDNQIPYNLTDYKNFHCEVTGLGTVCVEGCSALELFSIQVVVQGHVRTDVPSLCMCGTAFELDPEYRATPEDKYIFLSGDLDAYTNLHLEVKGKPETCAENCKSIKVDEVIIRPTIATEDHKVLLPSATIITQNYPNPFNPTTTINYEIAKGSSVNLCIYDILGKEVATLVNGEKKPGRYEVSWDASEFTSGIYYYRLKTGNNLLSGKMSLIK